jgi:uncharacterized protein (TIGR03083 family)
MIPGQRGVNDMNAYNAELTPVAPVYLLDLLPGLHTELMTLLRSLRPADWARPTACALWTVKDIVAHLLDGSLRRLSFGRDGLKAAPDPTPANYAELVAYLNRLNAEWTTAAARLSPRVLMDLLDRAAPEVHAFFRSLEPHGPAMFAVSWAGEESSPNWFDIGREYTERWLHQEQIREAVSRPGLTGRDWLHPTLDIFMRALPFTYRNVAASLGKGLRVEISGEAGGVWTLIRDREGWALFEGASEAPDARIILDQQTAWKLFSKGLSYDQARRKIRIEGDRRLGEPIFGSLAVMA